jgi:hypothetical protein
MPAKSELFERLKYLESALNLPETIDVGISPSEHNGRANLLRKGLGIVAFNILEDFIKNRASEGLEFISSSGVEFSNLPPKLQEASTLSAWSSVLFRAKIEKKGGSSGWLSLLQDEAANIHSTKSTTYKLSGYSLVSASSNIGAEEVSDMLAAFGIAGGWATLKRVSDAIGGGLPDLNQSYKNAADRRHKAAHTAPFQYDHGWLAGLRQEIVTIAACIDILLSALCRLTKANPKIPLAEHHAADHLSFRFLEPGERVIRETRQLAGRSRKNWTTEEDAVRDIQPRLEGRGEFLIRLSSARRIADWYC